MKAASTIQRRIASLNRFIRANQGPEHQIARRVAWEVIQSLRWVTEPVVGWQPAVVSAVQCAELIKRDLLDAAQSVKS